MKLKIPTSANDESIKDLYEHFCHHLDSLWTQIENQITHIIHNKKIAANSYIHPNGFYKIPIIETDYYGPKIRIHIWPHTQSNPHERMGDIHNHFWDYDSLVLRGRLRNLCYVKNPITDGPPFYDEFLLEPLPNDGCQLTKSDTVSLSVISDTTFLESERYSLASTEIHQAYGFSDSGFAATLIFQSRHKGGNNLVYRPSNSGLCASASAPHRPNRNKLISLLSDLIP